MFKKMKADEADQCRAEIVVAIKSCKNNISYIREGGFERSDRQTYYHPVLILDTDTYREKCNISLSDSNTYSIHVHVMKTDPTQSNKRTLISKIELSKDGLNRDTCRYSQVR